jgi:diacylglycerol kinase family enzyme
MLIVNPVSGKGRVKGFVLDILSVLCAGGEGITVFVTEKKGDATRFASQYGAEYDRIACTGGDGSLNEVISGLMTMPPESRPAIGYIPLGTTNDMAPFASRSQGQ